MKNTGIIEDSIYKNYQKSLKEGRLEQVQMAVDLAKNLREKIEISGFVDYTFHNFNYAPTYGTFFEPFPYRYYQDEGIVVVNKAAISLTKTENKLFHLFSENESSGLNIRVVSKMSIIDNLWPERSVTSSAVRTLIKRLRLKLEKKPKNPQIIINYHSKGYIFLGKRIKDSR